MASRPDHDVLLLDFGGVCLLNPVELHGYAEEVLGLAAGTLDWLGPIDPSTDPLWQEMTANTGLTERDYWAARADEVGKLAGRTFATRDYMAVLYEPARPELIRPEAVATVQQARAAGYGVSVLTNDLSAFHGHEWQQGIAFFGLVEHLIDCSDTGVLKPDPRAFARACEVLGADPARILFVDDLNHNADGARRFGLDALWFDVSRPAQSWAEVADRLGVVPSHRA